LAAELRLTTDDYQFGASVRDRDCDCCGRLIQAGETHLVGTNADGSHVRLAVVCAASRGLVAAEP
jgi:hypothetical protein